MFPDLEHLIALQTVDADASDARRLIDAGVKVAIASDCNPGSCFTGSLPLCIALAVREMGMTPAEAVHAATYRGAGYP